jgi:hypothetical protein
MAATVVAASVPQTLRRFTVPAANKSSMRRLRSPEEMWAYRFAPGHEVEARSRCPARVSVAMRKV